MFPARAGMNRGEVCPMHDTEDVPRTRGDEPDFAKEQNIPVICSPHARG